MGDTPVNLHETLQDSLDVVSKFKFYEHPRALTFVAAGVSTVIHHGTITSTRKARTSDYPSICFPRRFSNITRISVASEYL
jgi:hypothetical protein